MKAISIKFEHFSLLFVNCDEVYEYVLKNGGKADGLSKSLANTLRDSTVYIRLDSDIMNSKIMYNNKYRNTPYYYIHKFNVTNNDILEGCYNGLFYVEIDQSLDLSEMTDDELELFLLLNDFVIFDKNIDLTIK